jgi:hypothetical protein
MYPSAKQKVEGRGEEKKARIEFLIQIYKREKI